MTDLTEPTGSSQQPEPKPSPLDSSTIGLAFVLHSIKLNEAANTDDFERIMLHEVFPSVDTLASSPWKGEESTPDEHFLLSGRGPNEYVWMIRLEYFIHHTPEPTWLFNRATASFDTVKDKIEQFGTLASTEVLYDVKEWRQRLGLDRS